MSLFKGREDVFAIRWEKENRSGYFPAYNLDWNEFTKHKASGGSLKDFKNKSYESLTEERMQNHLSGKEVIGLYPLLTDNSSWFIVADFDESLSSKRSWMEDCRVFISECERIRIPAYLERSRSGSGGHIWIFFDKPYPAFKSRTILLYLLEKSYIISTFDKNSNYDRLFPNQDYHSGKGLGNLIALPLQKLAMSNANSCFINPDTEQAFSDQWGFLKTIQRVETSHLDGIYSCITKSSAIQHQHPVQGLSNDSVDILFQSLDPWEKRWFRKMKQKR